MSAYGGVRHGWAFRVGVGAWRWSLGYVGYTREQAAECARRYVSDHEPAFVAPVWLDCKPGASPIDACELLERADELFADGPCGYPDDGSRDGPLWLGSSMTMKRRNYD